MQHKIIMRSVDELLEYEANAKIHPKSQVEMLAKSIAEYGWTNPLLIDENSVIVSGHGRLAAARKLAIPEVPTITLDQCTPEQIRAYRIADNKLAEGSIWDEDILAEEISALMEFEFDLDAIGFDERTLSRVTAPELDEINSADKDGIFEPPIELFTVRPGQLWTLGDHRLVCGDCLDASIVALALDDHTPDLTIIDPPFENPALFSQSVPRIDAGRVLGVFWDCKRFADGPQAALEHGWRPKFEVVWSMGEAFASPNSPPDRHRVCGLFVSDALTWSHRSAVIRAPVVSRRATGHYEGRLKPFAEGHSLRSQEEFHVITKKQHPHEKPFPWLRGIFGGVKATSVFDKFAGGGVTLMVADSMSIPWIGIELDPAFCAVIIDRWQKRTGRMAIMSKDISDE